MTPEETVAKLNEVGFLKRRNWEYWAPNCVHSYDGKSRSAIYGKLIVMEVATRVAESFVMEAALREIVDIVSLGPVLSSRLAGIALSGLPVDPVQDEPPDIQAGDPVPPPTDDLFGFMDETR